MIKGIGTDIIISKRIEDAYAKAGHRFLERVYTSREIEYCLARPKAMIQHLAGRWAAKEAVVKALGTGFVGIAMKEIEVLNDEKGTPFAYILNPEIARNKKIHLSISHQPDYSVAFALIEEEA